MKPAFFLLSTVLCVLTFSCEPAKVMPLGSELVGDWTWYKTEHIRTGIVVKPTAYTRILSVNGDEFGGYMQINENGSSQKTYKNFSKPEKDNDKAKTVTVFYHGNKYVIYFLKGSIQAGFDELETTELLSDNQSGADTIRFFYRR
jgi:hypothetical protein